MQIGVPRETAEGERRVALVPEVVKKLVGQGHEVLVEEGAGAGALIPDSQYEEAGAKLVGDAWSAGVMVKVAPPSAE
jgi:H+-translocating NAD(P) transhydrogenase subunit alpha